MDYEVMSNWLTTKLGLVASFRQGIQVPVPEQSFKPFEKSVSFIRIVNYTQPGSEFRYIDSSYSKNKIQADDIVMVRYGTIGFVGRGYDGVIANNMFQIIPKNDINKNYLYYFLTYKKTQDYLKSQMKGGAMPALSFSIVKALPIEYPENIDEQKKIAEILGTWDEAIGEVEKLINQKNIQLRSLMGKLFAKSNRKPLASLAVVEMGQSPSSSAYNDSGGGLLFVGGNADIKNRTTRPRTYTSQVTKTASPGDLIMTVRAPVGFISKNHLDICIGRGVCAIKPKYLSGDYLFFALMYSEPTWKKLEQGSTFTAVNSKDIRQFQVPILEPAIIESTTMAFSSLYENLNLLGDKLKLLKRQKTGLMQKLLTGQVRVKVD